MSGFKAITVLKLCLYSAFSERRKKIRDWGENKGTDTEMYLTTKYLPVPSALPADTKATHFTPKVVGGGINKGEDTVIL